MVLFCTGNNSKIVLDSIYQLLQSDPYCLLRELKTILFSTRQNKFCTQSGIFITVQFRVKYVQLL